MASVCVICCEITRKVGGEPVSHGGKLSEALSQVRGPAGLSTGDNGKLICAICADTMEMAIVRKEELISTEERIRKLESLLEKLKGQRETGIGEYREQLKEVEPVVKESHGRINHLDTYFGEVGTKQELKEAIGLHNDVFSVVRGLRDFGKSLEHPKEPEDEGVASVDNPPLPPDEDTPAAPEAQNGSPEMGDQTPGTPRDTERDEGSQEVACNLRPIPRIRPCSVILQRIAIPPTSPRGRASGGNISCSKCGRHCQNKKGLKLHRCRVCTICKTTFSGQVQWRHHLRFQHPQGKPLKCAYCDKRCIFKYEMDSHVAAKHDPCKKRWICRDCTPHRAFSSSESLKGHQAVKHKRFLCQICVPVTAFPSLQSRRRHYLDNHKRYSKH